MSHKEIRAFDYVNQSYQRVRDAISADAVAIFQSATKQAEGRSGEVLAALSVDLGGLNISKDVSIRVGQVTEDGRELSRVTHIPLEWQAVENPGLFPAMKADLKVYPLSPTETQIELNGRYEPPMGVLGNALDRALGHRLAEASVHRFVSAIVERLRNDLAS